ncbi:MAG: 6-bladed beta-propeller [Burkholderiales bacterium]
MNSSHAPAVAALPIRRCCAGLLAAGLVAGCAAGAGGGSRFAMQSAPEQVRMVWPGPPEVPRYLYAGQLLGEANYRAPREQGEGVIDFLRWLAGVVVGERAPVGLQRPQSGIADDFGRIYVTDVSRQAVFVFDPGASGPAVWEKADGLSSFVTPTGIALGPEGTLLVADADLGIVARLDRDGNPGESIGRGQLKRPTGLAYDPRRRRIYVADTQAHDIKVFDERGALLRTIGRRGERDGEFNYPTYLALAGDELYVTDTLNHRVQVLSAADGRLRLKFGVHGLYVGNLVRPKGLAVDGEGNIYVVESYYDHLLVFNKRGEFLMAIGGLGTEAGKFYLPSGAWTDGRDRVFVADTFNGRVTVLQFLGGVADGEY